MSHKNVIFWRFTIQKYKLQGYTRNFLSKTFPTSQTQCPFINSCSRFVCTTHPHSSKKIAMPGLKSAINVPRRERSTGASNTLVFVKSKPCLLTKTRISNVSSCGSTGLTMIFLTSFTLALGVVSGVVVVVVVVSGAVVFGSVTLGKVGSSSSSIAGGGGAPDSSRCAQKSWISVFIKSFCQPAL